MVPAAVDVGGDVVGPKERLHNVQHPKSTWGTAAAVRVEWRLCGVNEQALTPCAKATQEIYTFEWAEITGQWVGCPAHLRGTSIAFLRHSRHNYISELRLPGDKKNEGNGQGRLAGWEGSRQYWIYHHAVSTVGCIWGEERLLSGRNTSDNCVTGAVGQTEYAHRATGRGVPGMARDPSRGSASLRKKPSLRSLTSSITF